MYHSFEELEVWKKATSLAVEVYRVLTGCKDFGFKDQITRAAVSIASNIAEGAERNSTKEYVHYLHIAKGSAAELRTQLVIGKEVGLLNNAAYEKLNPEAIELSKMLHGLIKSINLKS